MSELYAEFLPNFLDALLYVLSDYNYLIKGGSAIKYHLESLNKGVDARFSTDIDFAFSSKSFPVDFDKFKKQLIQEYNSKDANKFHIIEKNFDIIKIPKTDDFYFGIRMSLNIRKLKKDGNTGKKVFFSDINSLAIIADFTVNEIVEDPYFEETENKIRFATIPLIIAEKFRAICWQLEENTINQYKNPRPKDFYDIFILYTVHYKREISNSHLYLIKDAMKKCFSIKNMSLDLIDCIDNEKVINFHKPHFQNQVSDTLSRDSAFHDVTFDQVFSNTMELLDMIKSLK